MIWILATLCLLLARCADVRVSPKDAMTAWAFEAIGFARSDVHNVYLVPEHRIPEISLLQYEVRTEDCAAAAEYQSNADIFAELVNISAEHDFVTTRDVGTSENGQPLRVIRFERTDADISALVPRPVYRLVGNVHGNEIVSRAVLMKFVRHLLAYADTNADIRALLAKTTIEIMPTMNPDGFDLRTRGNANGKDLSRCFPDRFEGWDEAGAPREVKAIMNWMVADPPTLVAALHGGSVVCNYPWDGNAEHARRVYTAAPDDALLREVCTEYAKYNPTMAGSFAFPGGIVNGAYWYVLYGGMQDWVYETFGVPSVTIELSTLMCPSAQSVDTQYWPENAGSLVMFGLSAAQGVFGTVTDANTDAAIDARFEFMLPEQGLPFFARDGTIGRPLSVGGHHFRAIADGYSTREYYVEIEKGTTFILNVQLTRAA